VVAIHPPRQHSWGIPDCKKESEIPIQQVERRIDMNEAKQINKERMKRVVRKDTPYTTYGVWALVLLELWREFGHLIINEIGRYL
jgi:hypothetical protein